LHQTDLRATAHSNHLVAAGWIAIPADTTLVEARAAEIYLLSAHGSIDVSSIYRP
jgi:hypothetical protein